MHRRDLGPDDIRRMVGCLFVAAMVAAPFLALLYGFTLALIVMVCALAATSYLALDAAKTAPGALRHRFRIVAAINGALGLAGILVLAARLS